MDSISAYSFWTDKGSPESNGKNSALVHSSFRDTDPMENGNAVCKLV